MSLWRPQGRSSSPVSTHCNAMQPLDSFLPHSFFFFLSDRINHCIRRFNADGTGVGEVVVGQCGVQGSLSSDGLAATLTLLRRPAGICIPPGMPPGAFIFSSLNHAVFTVVFDGLSSNFVVFRTAGILDSPGFDYDDVFATGAKLSNPLGIDMDDANNLYIADSGNHRIRRVDSAGVITTLAGTGACCSAGGDGGLAVSAGLWGVSDVAFDPVSRGLFLADNLNHLVRYVSPGLIISTIAGSGSGTAIGDGPALTRSLSFPQSVSVSHIMHQSLALPAFMCLCPQRTPQPSRLCLMELVASIFSVRSLTSI